MEHSIKTWIKQQEYGFEMLKKNVKISNPFSDLQSFKTSINCVGLKCIKNGDVEGALLCKEKLIQLDKDLKRLDLNKYNLYKTLEGQKYSTLENFNINL